MDELEGIADAAYRESGLDHCRPHVPRLARALLGPDAVQMGPRPIRGPAALVRVGSGWRIILSPRLSPIDAHVACAHELGHWLIWRHGYVSADEERAADYLGGALMAPRAAFISARSSIGDEFCALAEAFGMTETGVALRVGEVFRTPLAVVSPAQVRVRGPEEWAWPDEETLRQWARSGAPGIKKTRLTDDPRRVVLDASDAT